MQRVESCVDPRERLLAADGLHCAAKDFLGATIDDGVPLGVDVSRSGLGIAVDAEAEHPSSHEALARRQPVARLDVGRRPGSCIEPTRARRRRPGAGCSSAGWKRLVLAWRMLRRVPQARLRRRRLARSAVASLMGSCFGACVGLPTARRKRWGERTERLEVSVLVADGVVKEFRNGRARVRLGPASFEVADGSFTALVGRSGSGKSTILNCVAGLARVTGGRVDLGGVDLTRLPEHKVARLRREAFGFVYQDYTLIDSLTGAENISLPARMSHRKPG